MIKIKIENKSDYFDNYIKCKDFSKLEVLILLNTAIDILTKEFNLSHTEIWKELEEFKNNYIGEESE